MAAFLCHLVYSGSTLCQWGLSKCLLFSFLLRDGNYIVMQLH